MKTAYLAGYTSRKPEQLRRLAEMLDAVVVDSRYSPRSRVAYWTMGALIDLLGRDRYLWVKSFGNRAYKEGCIELVNPFGGWCQLNHHPAANFIILCACKDGQTCHRKQVGEYLALHDWVVREVTEQEWAQAANCEKVR